MSSRLRFSMPSNNGYAELRRVPGPTPEWTGRLVRELQVVASVAVDQELDVFTILAQVVERVEQPGSHFERLFATKMFEEAAERLTRPSSNQSLGDGHDGAVAARATVGSVLMDGDWCTVADRL